MIGSEYKSVDISGMRGCAGFCDLVACDSALGSTCYLLWRIAFMRSLACTYLHSYLVCAPADVQYMILT